MLIFSASLGIYITVQNMNDFYKYEYVTNVEIASMTTANQSHKFVTFPAVTICTHKFLFVGKKTNGSQTENHVEIIHDMDLKPFILLQITQMK
jgi:hypothetical protein